MARGRQLTTGRRKTFDVDAWCLFLAVCVRHTGQLLPSVRHEYEYCDVCVNRSDDNMLDDCFQVSQRLTSDPATTHQQCHREIDNAANRADQRSVRHVRS